MSFLSVRPVRMSDLDALCEIAATSGTGMTTVPSSPSAMAERIALSEAAFAGQGKAGPKDVFFFVLDDGTRAVGMASIFPDLGADRPFYSYRLSHVAAQAPELDIRAETDVLHLVNDFHGYTEIGTLLVGDAARGKGAGRLLSLSRFAFLALHRERFGPRVMAEIRGWFDEEDRSPFWDAVASRFFHLSFQEADRRSAQDFRFIADLMPKYPIYVDLLPDEARETIGKPHSTSQYAMRMLETEGFEWTRCIDIFDGGPSLECRLDQIRTVRKARALTVRIGDEESDPSELVASPAASGFASLIASGPVTKETVTLHAAQAERLGLSEGEKALVTPLRAVRAKL
ncbi:arginine N-succinyltransferase [Parvularcula dongshanensis]|uniref:Arginine N-succinyltransferase n=1 Tax=Parvularcula dongshanensis TaxID=1173995 RepID=A0A840I074_9PROT|nr:arginine N-succinyltransferase [Parvularcula dongshanensis]MBB4657673.1 arginine N-succinyltransferase [Parvularcula dongshanensis]